MSFAKWMDEQKRVADGSGKEESEGLLGLSLGNLQDSMTLQMQELTGQLPDANGLTGAEFRRRMLHSIYLILGSIGFGVLAIFVGLPTIVLKPSKFVICISLSALCAMSSAIVLQKPSVFFSGLLEGGLEKATPVLLLFSSILFTLYSAIVVHKYMVVVFAGGIEVLAMFYYLSSFIPGGTTGLYVLLKSGWTLMYAFLTPCRLYLKSCISQLFS